jgi:chitin disaccharide deacetylase
MTRKLVVNADDYGHTPGVSQGIREAHLHGIVTSTTAMINIPGVENDLHLVLQECPRLGIGVHLVLTTGMSLLPASEVSTLINREGHFPGEEGLISRITTIDLNQVRAEWEAQVQKFVKITGKNPDHLDSHHHVACFSPEYAQNCLKMNQELLNRFKIPHPEHFIKSFYDAGGALQHLFSLLDMLDKGTSEMMCHPGFSDSELLSMSSYATQRQRELSILTDKKVIEFVQRQGIELITFKSIV